MLTKSHLAVLRAALQYFDEELGPHGMDIMWPYFEEEPAVAWTSVEIRELQRFLRDCELRYVGYVPATGELSSPFLSPSVDALLSSVTDPSIQVATVVLSPRS